MVPGRKFLQRQGKIFPPNLFTFQISVAITTRHNYFCEIFAFQVLPSSVLCGEFSPSLSITTHFFNQFGSRTSFSINTHKICCANLLRANREMLHFTDLFFPTRPQRILPVPRRRQTSGQLRSGPLARCIHAWPSGLGGVRTQEPLTQARAPPCARGLCALGRRAQVSGPGSAAAGGPTGRAPGRPPNRPAERWTRVRGFF